MRQQELKQIKLLVLSGTYVVWMLTENLPNFRGAALLTVWAMFQAVELEGMQVKG